MQSWERLRDPKKFPDLFYEFQIAASYLSHGHSVKLTEIYGGRVDLHVRDLNTYVECKRVGFKVSWSDIASEIRELHRRDLNLAVSVLLQKYPKKGRDARF